VDVFEALYQLSNVPTWLGWALGTGGCCVLSWLIGFNQRRK
jgi:hypothetical protein